MDLNYENLKKILLNGDFSYLKDQFENELIDVKEYPYDLSTDHGKEELCKDVSAMLNNMGGFILLGVKGEQDPNHRFERIKEVAGISAVLNESQYIDCLKNGMYPIESLVAIRECTLDGKKIFYIEIPKESTGRPFFRKRKDDFQYWQRTGSHATQVAINRLHEISKKGLEYENHLMNMEVNIEELVKQSKNIIHKQESLDNLKNNYEHRAKN